jgi:hypothetical protein
MSLGLHNSFSFELIDRLNKLGRGAQKLMGDNMKNTYCLFQVKFITEYTNVQHIIITQI